MVVFYLSAFVVVLNLNAYKKSIFIFGYFTISILSSICIDLKIDIFSSKTVYNIYDLFLGPTVMFSSYIFNSWKKWYGLYINSYFLFIFIGNVF